MPPCAPFATRYAPRGLVCSVDALASSAGVGMLRAGGSAVDAAVAASAVLAVTSQHLCGMGGDLFALVYRSGVDSSSGPAVLNASGRAGSGASAARVRDEGYTTMPFRGDVRSAPVPGCVDGWVELHSRFGRLPLSDVLAPAVEYADAGFPVSPTLEARLPAIEGVVGADDYFGGGPPVRTGTLIRRPGVARTLAAIGAGGRGAFYEGEFGSGLLDVGGGEYTAADLAASQADWVEPAYVDVWGRRLWTVPPNSQGYLTLAGAWIAAGLPALSSSDLDPDDPLWAHLLIESARQAAFDRLAVLSEDADWRALVSPSRLAPRRDAISVDGVSSVAFPPMPGGTTYLCAVDSQRMGVSLIQSNASGWGCHVVEPSTRIFLHNRGIGFSLVPGHPAEYAPRRRPPHTLSPALVTDSSTGLLDVVLGTMGGDSQPQVLLQLLARLLRGDGATASVASAIAAGRWVLRPLGDSRGFDTWAAGDARVRVAVEGHASAAWDDGLRALGHSVTRVDPWDAGFGHAHAIRLLDGGDVLAGAADPRTRFGDAAGW